MYPETSEKLIQRVIFSVVSASHIKHIYEGEQTCTKVIQWTLLGEHLQ